MIVFFVALYYEAKPIIKYFNMKKSNVKYFNIYETKNIKLIITGTGKSSISSAVGFLVGYFENTVNIDECAFINIGVCGFNYAEKELPNFNNVSYNQGSMFLCSKIIDKDTKHEQYCDLLLNHDLNEATLITCSLPVENDQKTKPLLFDMEGFSFVSTAKKFISSDRVFVIKIISDLLNPDGVTKDIIIEIIEKNLDSINNTLYKIEKYLAQYYKPLLSKKETHFVNKIITNLNLTKTQQSQFNSLIAYYILSNKTLDKLSIYECKHAKSTTERNKYFEEIKQLLLK